MKKRRDKRRKYILQKIFLKKKERFHIVADVSVAAAEI